MTSRSPGIAFSLAWALLVLLSAAWSGSTLRAVSAPDEVALDREHGLWRVGIEKHFPPISDISSDGNPTGFAPALLGDILDRRGIRYRVIAKTWPELLKDFEEDRLDVLASAAYSPERLRSMAFSKSFIDLSVAVVHRRTLHLPSPISLDGLRLASQKSGRLLSYTQRRGWTVEAVPINGLDDALLALSQEKADVAIVPRAVAFRRAQQLGLENRLSFHKDSLPGTELSLHFAVRPADRERLAILNAGLEELIKNGDYQHHREQWVGPYEIRPQLLRDLAPFLIPALLLIVLLFAVFLCQRRGLRLLKHSEARLKLVIEGAGDALWDWDLVKHQYEVGPEWATLWREPSLCGGVPLSTIEAHVHSEHRDQFAAACSRLLGEDMPLDIAFRLEKHPEVWLHLRGRVLEYSRHKTPLRATGTCSDITVRKAAELALSESRLQLKRSGELLHQAQMVAHIGAWEYDADKRSLVCSEAVLQLLGLPSGSQLPSPGEILPLVLDGYRDFILTAVLRALAQADGFDVEVPVCSARGSLLYLRCICVAEQEEGRVTRLYGSIQDTTELKTMEETRVRLQRNLLESQRVESLGALSGGVAHDFNNLLTTITNNISLVRMDLPEGEQTQSLLAQAETASRRAAEICRQMLVYSGQTLPTLLPVRVQDHEADILQLAAPILGGRSRLVLDLQADARAIFADWKQIQQILRNLLQNAAEASVQGRPVTVTLRTTQVSLTASDVEGLRPSFAISTGDHLCLSVIDDGCGMEQESLQRIFEPFFSTKFTGRGLGLASVHGIVRSHQGAIQVESSKGRGSAFRIFFPSLPLDERDGPRLN